MRLDKFLKVSRIIKRRPLAKQVAEEGRIKVNGVVVKPSISLEAGDEVEITFARKKLTIVIEQLKDHVKKTDATDLYKVVKEEQIDID